MTSNDFVIRTERSVIDVVLSNESEIKALRRDFEDFKAETKQEFKNVRQEMKEGFTALVHQQEILASEIRGLNRHIDSMTTIFGWGFTLVAIAVAIAPMLREFFVYRHDKNIHEEISRQIDAKLSELMKKQS